MQQQEDRLPFFKVKELVKKELGDIESNRLLSQLFIKQDQYVKFEEVISQIQELLNLDLD